MDVDPLEIEVLSRIAQIMRSIMLDKRYEANMKDDNKTNIYDVLNWDRISYDFQKDTNGF